jgi:hypothetical protein
VRFAFRALSVFPRPIQSFRVLLVTRTQSTVPGPGRSTAFLVFS